MVERKGRVLCTDFEVVLEIVVEVLVETVEEVVLVVDGVVEVMVVSSAVVVFKSSQVKSSAPVIRRRY